jgi:replicative DNA helicase
MPTHTHDREAEQRAVAAMLFSQKTRATLMGEIEAGYFYSGITRSIFEAMLDAERQGFGYTDASGAVEVDSLGLSGDSLRAARSLSVGVPALAIDRDLGRIKSAHAERAFGAVLEDAGHRLSEGGDDVDTLAASLMGRLEDLLSRGGGQGAVHISESAQAVRERAQAVMRNEGIVGLRTGIGMIDRHTGGLQRGRNYVVGGRAGVGKSTFVGTVVRNIARQGASVLVQTTEMGSDEYLERLARAEAGITDEMWHEGRIATEDMQRLEDSLDSLSGLKIFVDGSSSARLHPDLAVVDYLQRMQGPAHVSPDASEYVRVTETSLAVDRLKTSYDVPLLTAVQLNRGSEHTADHIPQLHHLRSSGQLEQDANVVMLLHREKGEMADPEAVDLYCRKNRHGAGDWNVRMYRQKQCSILTDGRGL